MTGRKGRTRLKVKEPDEAVLVRRDEEGQRRMRNDPVDLRRAFAVWS